MPLEDYLASGPPHERAVVEAVVAHLESLGPLHVEPVSVGVLLKRSQTFAQLRPMQRWEALSFSLLRPVHHRLIIRKVVAYDGRHHHVANLRSAADLDDHLRAYLTEAYLDAPT